MAGATNGLGRYLARFEWDDYLPSELAVIGTHADNEDLGDGDTSFLDRWNAAFAWPRMRLSTFDEYLAAVAPLRDRLPVWRCEMGSYWEDGVGSAAGDFAVYRRAQALLPAAETLGALVSVQSDSVRTNRHELDRARADLAIAAEHTLTWARTMSHPHAFPVSDQLGWKTRYIHDAYRVSTDEMRRHIAQLADHADLIGPGFVAYNPRAWSADLDGELDLIDGVELVGPDGIVPVEVLSSCAGLRRCRVRLEDVPPHAWRFFPISEALLTVPGGERDQVSITATDDVDDFDPVSTLDAITSEGWVIELDPTTLLPRRIQHRSSGCELVDPSSPVRLGQLLRTGEQEFSDAESTELTHPRDTHSHQRKRTLPIENFRYVADPAPSDLVTESPTVEFVGRRTTFDGVRLRWRGQGSGVRGLTIELLLRDTSATAELDVSFVKQPCLDMEALYVCFPFAGTDPIARYDRPLGWVQPGVEHGPGASNEWAAVTHAVSIDSSEGEIVWTPLDTPLFTVGDVVRGAWPTEQTSSAHLYSYAMNNFWPCNVPAWQPGPVHFRYRFGLTSGFDPVSSSRVGRTNRLDAQVVELLPLDRFRPQGEPEYRSGNLGLASPDTVDLTYRQSADPSQSRLRVTNLAADPITASIDLPAELHHPDRAEGSREVSIDVDGYGSTEVLLRRRN